MESSPIDLSFIPLEIIELILQNENLTVVDVCNFGSTCSRYWSLINESNQIWKTKFCQMWPNLLKHESYKNHKVLKWDKEFRIRWSVRQHARKLLDEMSACHIKREELSAFHFKPLDKVLDLIDHKFGLQLMIDELMFYVHHKNRNINLTKRYYSEKAIRYLRQIELKSKWEDFKNASPEEQLLEKGAVILAQWIQPTEDIPYQSIESQLNAIAEKVIEQIRLTHCDEHVSLEVSEDVRSHWRTHNLVDNNYSPHISRQVINAVSTVLFKELGFNVSSDVYYSLENSCINKVLDHRQGIPITFAILYESVCRRLGIKLEAVCFPGHSLLRWRDTYRNDVPAKYFYIDMCNGGTFLDRSGCPQFSNGQSRCPFGINFGRLGPATAVQVMERLASCLEVAGRQCTTTNGRSVRLRSALELLHLIAPTNINCLIKLANFYIQYNMDVSILRQEIETISLFNVRDLGQITCVMSTLTEYDEYYRQHNRGACAVPDEVKTRTGGDVDVQFAVGMVLHHRQHNYKCVVVGWDTKCLASSKWMIQMNVRALSRQHDQPFYHVLVSDGTNRYAAEENLEMENNADLQVTHSDVGRFFDSFCQTHYQPNTELSRAYPEDFPVLQQRLGLFL